MIRSFATSLILLLGSISYAATDCSQITLECRATYRSYSADSLEQWVDQKSAFADEQRAEPSLKNCASTMYFTAGDLSVRVRAVKDNETDKVTTTAQAVQLIDYQIGNQTLRSAAYSNIAAKSSTVGGSFGLSTLVLPEAYSHQNRLVQDVIVSCQTK